MKNDKELVRYSFIRGYVKTNSGFRKRRIIKEHELGEYVRYDQAAAVIAAKDAEIQELKENLGVVITERHADAEYIGQLQTELAELKNNMIELQSDRVVETMSYEKMESELAQIKEQEPVAVVRFDRSDGNENEMPKVVSCNWLPDGNYPLYATPVDQTVEIERLRKALKLIASETAGLDLHDARDISRAALSEKDPS